MSLNPQPRLPAKVIHLQRRNSELTIAPDSIAVASNGRIDVIQIQNIAYLRSDNNYTHIYLADGNHILACKTLKTFQEHLQGCGFLRVHNQYLVSGKSIASFYPGMNKLILSDECEVPVSRSRKHLVLEYLKSSLV